MEQRETGSTWVGMTPKEYVESHPGATVREVMEACPSFSSVDILGRSGNESLLRLKALTIGIKGVEFPKIEPPVLPVLPDPKALEKSQLVVLREIADVLGVLLETAERQEEELVRNEGAANRRFRLGFLVMAMTLGIALGSLVIGLFGV